MYFDKEKKIKIIYKTQTISKNNIYYKCQKRPKYPVRRKLCLNNEIFTVITKCDYNINHEDISYKEFKQILEKNSLKSLNFENNIKL